MNNGVISLILRFVTPLFYLPHFQPVKKIVFSIVFIAMSFVNGYTQTDFTVSELNRLSIDLSAGPSIPVGAFASKSPGNLRSGYAKTGEFFAIRATYMIGKYFGITASYRLQANKIDHDSVYAAIRPTVPSDYASMKLETGTWRLGSLLIGPCFRIPFNSKKRTFFESHLMAGNGSLYMPKQETRVSIQGSGQYSIYKSQESITITGLTALTGCSFRRIVTPHISLNAGIDFQAGVYKKDNVQVLQSDGTYQSSSSTNHVMTFDIGFGASYLFL